MADPNILHSTFTIERNYPQPPDQVFAAFAQPARKRRWYAEGDHEIQEYELDFRIGGTESFRYRFKEGHPIAGSEIANQTTYQDVVPGQRILQTNKMTLNGKTIQVMLGTVEFQPSGTGTDLIFTYQGTFIEWPGGPKSLEGGWRLLFQRLETHLAQ